MKHVQARFASCLAAAVFCTAPLWAADLEDLHLPVTPRTEAETARVAAIVAPTTDFTAAETFETNAAGAATVPVSATSDAFSRPSGNITFERELDFKVGNGLFRKLWVSAPSSTLASDGLGPLYNARSCQRCHLKDGRGHPPEGPDDNAISMLVRLSIPGHAEAMAEIQDYISTAPEPTYGSQVQDLAIAGHPAEARFTVAYTEVPVALSEGQTASLRVPQYRLTDLGYGPLHPQVMTSPRVAPQMIGLGLLDAIPAQDILALADPEDRDGDGVSGRANIVPSAVYGKPMLGRFGLKAGQPSVWEQSAAAFHGDIGISTPLHPEGYGDCTGAQTRCRTVPDGNTPAHDNAEISSVGLELVAFYASNLGVPARRDVDDPEVLQGKRVFYETGCTACHRPKHVTHRLQGQPEQSFQLIWPYTDMLLHDMGPALADNRPEARATGREWRTPPLWGIGLTQQVSGHTYFLHDGRARSLLEAILWHGGEAEAAKNRVVEMPRADRAALLRFLESL
ncbi:c-type cytochrome [Roseobacter sp. YSTF-M11]|uniref:C-type cytochrome n=1 Tax=Roseobacter insulae TaxID=2859783 RepID=A0A9X1FYK5_9RHOB|nr:di-heme oxidoredictase family protein [Roseobacter insulae]MBW4709946.1 c-type cytochrome [Roseobacter insulae]